MGAFVHKLPYVYRCVRAFGSLGPSERPTLALACPSEGLALALLGPPQGITIPSRDYIFIYIYIYIFTHTVQH